MKYAILDIGSNSIRLCVYKVEQDLGFKVLFTKKVMAGLVNYVKGGLMSERGISRAASVINEFGELAENVDVSDMHIFATASFRNIDNTGHVVDEILKMTGRRVEVLSGYDEAMLGFCGAMECTSLTKGVMLDTGGGSCEIVLFKDRMAGEALSLPIGSLNLYTGFVSDFLPNSREIKNIKKKIDDEFKCVVLERQKAIIGVGGTIKAFLKVVNYYFKLDKANRVINKKQFKEIAEIFESNHRKSREIILKTCPERVHTIIPGMLIFEKVMTITDADEIAVSSYGVREGYLCRNILNR